MKSYLTPAEVREQLKSVLGLNSKQVTVKQSHSIRYLDITIRDPKVSVPAVELFAKERNTWTMDETDYCEGQSLSVHTTKEVDQAHAAPWMAAVLEMIPLLENLPEDQGLDLEHIAAGMFLFAERGDVYIQLGRERRCYRSRRDVLAREQWAIDALALDIARLLENQPAPLPEWMEEIDETQEVAPFEPVYPETAPEPENVVQFHKPAAPAPVSPERAPIYEDKPRHFTQQRMTFAESDLFALR